MSNVKRIVFITVGLVAFADVLAGCAHHTETPQASVPSAAARQAMRQGMVPPGAPPPVPSQKSAVSSP
jgi:H+/gluconate symporter-like permease